MGHVVFGIPRIEHYHLHSRVLRKLCDRDHRVTFLTTDPVVFEFFCAQGMRVVDIRPTAAAGTDAPLEEFARIDCMLHGHSMPTALQLQAARKPLERVLCGLNMLFEMEPPDLLYLHQGRSGVHRLLHFLGRQHGAPVMHTGDGLLPNTMQWDQEGIDGDASFTRHTAQDYRRQEHDDVFLAATLSAWLARAYPPPLGRVGVRRPRLRDRLRGCVQAAARGQWRAALGGLDAWQQAYAPAFPRRQDQPALPHVPYVVVLLQPETSPRLLLDAGGRVDHVQLVRVAREAIRNMGEGIPTAVVLPDNRGHRTLATHLEDDQRDLVFLPASAGALAVSTAMAVITVNHPLGLCAILAGTPVVHLGRTPYGVRGIAQRSSLDDLAEDLKAAMAMDNPILRRRFLTRMLKDYHLWCAVHRPDSNGITGLVKRIEGMMARQPENAVPLHYRAGPVWPLSVQPSQEEWS